MTHRFRGSSVPSFRFTIFLGIVLSALFVVSELLINDFQSLNLPWWFIGVSAFLFIAGLTTLYVKIFSASHKEEERRSELYHVFKGLSSLAKLPQSISEEKLSKNAEELAVERFCSLLEEYEYHKKVFVCFLIPEYTYRHPETHIDDAFYRQIEIILRKKEIFKPLVFSAPFGTFRLPKKVQELVGEYETFDRPPDKPDRVQAHYKFGGDFCLVLPFSIHSSSHNHQGRQQQDPLGYIGIIEDEFISDSIANDLTVFLQRFEELYYQVKEEKIRVRIDRILNESQVRLLEPSPKERIPLLFAKKLSPLLRAEFIAERVELWLKGMLPEPGDSIFQLANEIQNGQYSISMSDQLNKSYNHSLDVVVKLHNSPLGLIRILRNKFGFSEMEKEQLRVIEQIVDNYVRDLWEEHILRTIDHKIFNRHFSNLKDFAEALLQELVKEFDAYCGLFEIQNHPDVFYMLPTYDEAQSQKVLNTLKRDLRGQVGPIVNIFKDIFYLFIPLSIAQGEPLGALYMLGKGQLTDVHLDALKRLEAQMDNILQLYLFFAKQKRIKRK